MNRRLRGTSPLQEIEAVDSEPTFEGNIASWFEQGSIGLFVPEDLAKAWSPKTDVDLQRTTGRYKCKIM
jgi:hypothetical protein